MGRREALFLDLGKTRLKVALPSHVARERATPSASAAEAFLVLRDLRRILSQVFVAGFRLGSVESQPASAIGALEYEHR